MKKFNLQKNNYSKGVALLFAIVVSMILFTILAGVLNIALKETIFSTSIKSSNDAFYIADSAVECALLNDKSDSTVFVENGDNTISCFNRIYPVVVNSTIFSFVVSGLDKDSCANVSVEKIHDGSEFHTSIISKGYNKGGSSDCVQTGLQSVERVLEVTY